MKNKIIVGGFLYESLTEEEYSQYNSQYDHILGSLGYKNLDYSSQGSSGEEYVKRVGKADVVFDDLSYNQDGDLSLSFGIRRGSHFVYSQRIFVNTSGLGEKISAIDKVLTVKAEEFNTFIDKIGADIRSSFSGFGAEF